MKHAVKGPRYFTEKVTPWDIAAAIGVMGYFLWSEGWTSAAAALYGYGIVAINRLYQMRQLHRADKAAGLSPEKNLRYLYRCAVERFFVSMALLLLAIAILELKPVPLILGFIVGQLAMVMGYYRQSSLRRNNG
jgi:ATP synthase protein I